MGSAALGRVLAELPMTALDVGARGGFAADLAPIAWAIDAVGLEADPIECARLNTQAAARPGAWRSLRFIPAALAGSVGRRTLCLTRHRGTSSLLEGDEEFGKRFARPDYYAVEQTLEVDTTTLDELVIALRLDPPAFMKIDVEGIEKEVIEGAPQTRDGLLGLRLEAAFARPRRGQPLFHEIDASLRDAGFIPMGFEELHHWRRRSLVKHPKRARGLHPYSRGQMIHADILYLRDLEAEEPRSEEEVRRWLQCAFVALCYEYVDHALALFERREVAQYLAQRHEIAVARELGVVSRWLHCRYRARRRRMAWRAVRDGLAECWPMRRA